MVTSQSFKRLSILASVAAYYLVATKLGLQLAFVHASATAVWPGTGIALWAFLRFGYHVWPAIFAGAFLVNVTTAGSAASSLGIGIGNTLEGLAGAYLINRFANGRNVCDRAGDIFKLVFLSAALSTTVSASTGVASLSLGDFARSEDFGSIWLTWWLGNAMGCLIVAPLLLLWTANPHIRWNRSQILEAAALLLSLFFVGLVVFGGLFASQIRNYPLEFLCAPLLIWVAFRFGQREAAIAIVVLSGVAIWGTLHGFGPFASEASNEALLLLQAFMGVTSVTTLSLAAVVSERRHVEDQLRQLSVTDPLTALANYRQMINVLNREIKRSERTERPFAFLFLDVDDMKEINDHYGHVAGNRALCRIADALRESCRAMDTGARFGGDEFALILPETEEAEACKVASRIAERLARENEEPRLSVSIGAAAYPAHGQTIEALLTAADGSLYDAKARGRRVRPQPRRSTEGIGENTPFQRSAAPVLAKGFSK